MAKRTTITIETDSLLILGVRTGRRAWCPQCGVEAEMIAPAITSVSPDNDQRLVEKWLNSEHPHRVQAMDGSALICLNSLLALVRKTKNS